MMAHLRNAQFSLKHLINLRQVDECGPDSVLAGRVQRRQDGGLIEVGAYSFLHCSLVTNLSTSRLRIGDNCFVNAHTVIECFQEVQIGDDALIGWEVVITDGQNHSLKWADRRQDQRLWRAEGKLNEASLRTAPVIIEPGVWIGARAMVLPGVTIGMGSTIGAGSVVTKPIPAYSVAVGNPARVVGEVEP